MHCTTNFCFMNRRILIFFLFFNLICFNIFSHNGDKHIKDMADVLGVSISKNNQLESLLLLVTNIVDDNTGRTSQESLYGGNKYYKIGENIEFYKKLQSDYSKFTYTTEEYTHRILFHWGFDKIDRDLLKKNNSKNYPLYYSFCKYVEKHDDSKWSSFKRILDEKQKTKAFNLTNAFYDFFKFRNLDTAYNMASLCYYVHILGDHIGFTNKNSVLAVMSTENIIYELDKVISNLAFGIGKSYYLSYAQEIEKLYSKKNRLSDIDYSERVMNLLKNYVPKIIRANYSKEFELRGIIPYSK